MMNITKKYIHKFPKQLLNIIAGFFYNHTTLLAKIVQNNKCFPTFFNLDYLYKIFAFIFRYKPVIFNYVKTLGFIHSLHISLNLLYSFMYTCTNIWKGVFILHIIGYAYLPLYLLVPVSKILLGSLLIYYCILFWNNFVYKAYINDKFWLFIFYFIIFLIFFFLATTLIVSETLFLYKVLTLPKGEGKKRARRASDVSGSSSGQSSPGKGKPGPGSTVFKGAGHDTREKPKDDNNIKENNPDWYLGSTSEPEAEDIAKVEKTDSINLHRAKANYMEAHKEIQRNKEAFNREHNKYQVRAYNHGMDSPQAKEAKDKYEKVDKFVICGRRHRAESANEIKQIIEDEKEFIIDSIEVDE